MEGRWVEIEFDCLPLRAVGRVDPPVDASPRYQAFVLRVKESLQRHGALNAYYLHAASCTFYFTNDPQRGMVRFRFEGTVLTDEEDRHSRGSELEIELEKECCDWLTQPVVTWLTETVRHAVLVEFDRFIAAGDLKKAEERIRQIEAQSEATGGYLGMYL